MKNSLTLSGALLATTMLLAPGSVLAQEAPAEQPAQPETTETIVVRGVFIPEPQRRTSQVASFLTTEDLDRQGDANAAIALTRVSGLSIVGGRFAYVRGLGDRYSSALLNGSPLPSPEPLRRTVPLDLFPSDVLEGITVQKTYSARYPGDFGGGVIDLRSRKRPGDTYVTSKLGIGFNTETTGQEGVFVRGGDLDWTGYDDGLRDLPAPIASVINSGDLLSSLTPDELEVLGESFVNSPLNVLQTGDLGPNFSGGLEAGTDFYLGDYQIGLIGVGGYDQSWTTRDAIRQFVTVSPTGQGNLGIDQQVFQSTLDATVNGLGVLSIGYGGHEVLATALYVHSTSKEASITTGTDFNAPGATGEIYEEGSGWFERALIMGQLAGTHEIGNAWELQWRGALAQSTRDAPYERTLRRFINADGDPAYLVANNNITRFSELTDDIVSGGADLSYTADLPGGREGVFSVGVDQATTERTFEAFDFRFAGGNSLPLDVQTARPDFLFSPDNIDPARFSLIEVPSLNVYTGDLDVLGAYAQGDVELTDFIRATVGVRYEDGEQAVQVFARPTGEEITSLRANLQNTYYLPSLTFTWNFADDLQVRLGYSETIGRPQFRELAGSRYTDPDTDRVYRGNQGLIDSELTNYDARLEYYLGRDQFVTVAGFYKEILNPIEEVRFETTSFNFETSFINSPKATLFGGEFEYRTYFESPIKAQWLLDRDWRFAVNYTYTSTEIEVQGGDTVFDPLTGQAVDATLFGLDGKQLQGSPEHILNTQFGWESDADELTLLVGWVDERVLQRGFGVEGGFVLPDIIEDPGIQLDLVYRRDFDVLDRTFTVGLSGRNLLNEDYIEYQDGGDLGELQANTYERGRSFSLSLTAPF